MHSTRRERFEYDTRGLRSARAVTPITPSAGHVAFTRYEHDAASQLVANSLPDDTRLV